MPYKDKEKAKRYKKGWLERNVAKTLIYSARYRAKKNGIPFSITESDIVIPEVCPVLGIELNRSWTGRMEPNSPSLDRFINELGYVPGNINVISWKANSIKSDASLEELKRIVEWLEA